MTSEKGGRKNEFLPAEVLEIASKEMVEWKQHRRPIMQFHKDNSSANNKGYMPFVVFLNDGFSTAHRHPYAEMLYIIEGELSVVVNNREFNLTEDALFFINAHDVHYTRNNQQRRCLYFVIQFESSVIIPDFKSFVEVKYLLPFLNSEITYNETLNLKVNDEIKSILNNIIIEFELKNVAFELEIKGSIYRLLASLIRSNFILMPTIDISEMLPLKKLLIYIEENYAEKITVEEAADMVNMSYSYFSKYFKKAIGENFTTYLNYIRLIEAEKLLLSTDKNVSEIAYETGFCSANYFIRMFQKKYNMTPLNFKKQNRVID